MGCWNHCCWIVQGVVGNWVDLLVERCFDLYLMKVDVVGLRDCDVPVERLVVDLSYLKCWVEKEVAADGCDLRCVSEDCLMKCMGEGLR